MTVRDQNKAELKGKLKRLQLTCQVLNRFNLDREHEGVLSKWRGVCKIS